MPLTKTAKKELRKSKKKAAVNFVFKNNMKIAINVFLKKIQKWVAVDQKDLQDVQKKIDKAYKKNIIHRNNAARKKSLIMRRFNAIEK